MGLRPLNTQNSLSTNFSQVNDMIRQLNKEAVTKTYKQAGGNAILEGKLPYEGGYGSLYYDSDGVPRILIGINPDGGIGLYASKPGESVIDAFS